MSALSLISRHFPPPHVLTMPHIGVDISDRSIKFAALRRKGQHLALENYGSIEIPEGLIKSGVVINPLEVGALCKKLLEKYHAPFVALSLPEEKAYVFSLALTGVPRDEIRSAVELQLESYVPLPPDNTLFDIDIAQVSKDAIGTTGTTDIAVSVFPLDVAHSYLEVLRAAGLTASRFEIEAQSVARALVPRASTDACMIVDIGRSRTGFAIVERGVVQHSATVPVGGDTLTLALASRLGLSEEIARATKEERGLVRTKDNEEIWTILSGVASALRDEISKHYEFWSKQKTKSRGIGVVYICGGDANIPGMREYLRTGLMVPVEYGNPWANISRPGDHVPSLPFNQSLQYASALGLALADQQ